MSRVYSRRELLRVGGGALIALPFAAACSGFAEGGANVETDSSAGTLLRSTAALPTRFTMPLPVPPVLRPSRSDADADYYQVTQQVAQIEILPGLKTAIWGYNGIFPGPTIVSRRGRTTVVEHRNQLPVPTVVHLHGGKAPPEHDGYPTDLLLPASGWHEHAHGPGMAGSNTSSGVRQHVYPIDQSAATLWYHDHRMDFTGPQVYKGLAGFHLVHDDEEEALPLPKADRDIPLMIVDRAFAEDGSLRYPSLDGSLTGEPGVQSSFMSGVLGDCLLVNGAPWPQLEVANTRYRFRILNASNARRYLLALDPPPKQGPSFVQVGSDAGLLAAPRYHDQIQIAQAQRFDVVVDFSGYSIGDKVIMRNKLSSGGTGQVMRFVIARSGTDDSRVPSRLVGVRRLAPSQATVTRELTFHRGEAERHGMPLWTVDGKPFDPERIDANPRLGAIERWKVRAENVPHPVHIHLAHFQVAGRDGGDPGPYDAGWKDTIDLDTGGQADLLLKFDGFRGKYVFHCHNLEHEDMGMMGNFEVR
ncbi:MAG TPA: multicopper oxidase family protein [Candidatus Dormibacteraeota bacterium]|nr:multicopper oxidase family protein [Candidatus Dormibacteraeota bacterium]